MIKIQQTCYEFMFSLFLKGLFTFFEQFKKENLQMKFRISKKSFILILSEFNIIFIILATYMVYEQTLTYFFCVLT